MKKTLFILGVLFALLSCDKESTSPEVEAQSPEGLAASQPVNFNVTVEDIQTRAASKSAWANGDVIYVVFKGITTKYLWLTYNSGSWNTTASSDFAAGDFSGLSDKKLTAVYFPVTVTPSLNAGVLSFTDASSNPVYTYYLKQTDKDYTVDGANVSFSLSLAIADGYAQFHIPGIQSNVADYTFKANGVQPVACSSINASTGAITENAGTDGAAFKGFADADGGVFSARVVNPGNSQNYVFTLADQNKAYVFSKTRALAAGKFYKFNAPSDASWSKLYGKFTVASGKQVYFSPGNLQATTTDGGANWTWSFAPSQLDFVGNAAANTAISGNGTVSTNGTVDLFGWSTSATYYGIHNSNSYSVYSGDFVDWGGVMGSGWRTLTSGEWTYVFTTRSGTNYAKAQVNGVNGVILLPDDWQTSYYNNLTSTNTVGANFTSNQITSSDWASAFEAHGAVFLPAAGYRSTLTSSTLPSYSSSQHGYWSGSKDGANNAKLFYFTSSNMTFIQNTDRSTGYSVRLVRDAQ